MNENVLLSERLEYLKKIYRVKSQTELSKYNSKHEFEHHGKSIVTCVLSSNDKAILAVKISDKVTEKRNKITILISDSVFNSIVKVDPTDHKEYVQWMLSIFKSTLKSDDDCIHEARRFVEEDLDLAAVYIDLFRKNKQKKLFKEMCESSLTAPKNDPTNINQYSSLSQLYDAVDPFMERDSSTLLNSLERFVTAKQAIIPFRDRKFTVYIPLTNNASCVMNGFVSWCTAREDNGMFKKYCEDYKMSDGSPSKLYIIINNEMFSGTNNECYQVHFETSQFKGRENGNVNIYECVLSKSNGISEYFKNELITLLKNNPNNKKLYSDNLIRFGHTESLFEIYDKDTKEIQFKDIEIPKLPDMSMFKNATLLSITNASLVTLPESVGNLSKLKALLLANNKLTSLPKSISNLQELEFINLNDNNIVDFPDDIAKLDKSNGGSLVYLSVSYSENNNIDKLRKLLPNTFINLYQER